MFEVGWSEMLVIAIVMIVVVGPKDLPAMLRTFGRTVAKLRGMAGDFQKQFNDALKEAELDDVKKSVDSLRSLNPMAEIRKQLNPFEKAAADVRSGLDDVMKPKPAAVDAKAATPEASPAEPAAGSTPATPVAGGPEAIPASATFPAMTDASVVADAKPAAPKKPAKLAATKAAKAAPEKATTAKAAAAPKIAEKPAAKAVPAKATTTKAVGAPKAAEKPAPKAVQPAAAKPEAKPAVTAAKKPAAARKKTAGTAK